MYQEQKSAKQLKAYFSGFDKQNEMRKRNPSNTILEYHLEDHCIQFLSDGGHQFSVPIDVVVQVIHILTEGILIGWGREGDYSYCTLGTHPMESISPLGRMSKDKIDMWLNSPEQIIYTSRKLPVLVSYNTLLQRHSISLIRQRIHDVPVSCSELQYFPSLLSGDNRSRIICDIYYEENMKESKIVKCKVIKGLSDMEVIFCMLYQNDNGRNYVKLFALNNLQEFSERKDNLRVVQVIQNVEDITTFNLYNDFDAQQTISIYKEQNNHISNQVGSILRATKTLKTCLILQHQPSRLSLLYGSKIILNYNILTPIQAKDIVSKSIQKSKLILQTSGCKYECECFPKIQDQLLISCLKAMQLVIDAQQFSLLLRDILVNCINLHEQNIELDENQQASQFEDQNQFTKFTYYIVFMMKLCGGNKQSQEQPLKKKIRISNISNSIDESLPRVVDKAFQSMMNVSNSIRSVVPNKIVTIIPNINARIQQKFIIPKFDMTLTMFSQISERLFYALHLLYCDSAISRPRQPQLLYFLYSFAVNMDSEHSMNYLDYYLRKDPTLQNKYTNDNIIPQLPTLRPSQQLSPNKEHIQSVLPPQPQDLSLWASNLFRGFPIAFPFLHKETKHICTSLEYLIRGKDVQTTLHLPSFLLHHYPTYSNDHPMPLFVNLKPLSPSIQSYDDDRDLIAFHLLMKRNWSLPYLQKLPVYMSLPFLEMLARQRKAPERVADLFGRNACNLLGRIDCYRNWKLYSAEPSKKRFKTFVDQTIRGQKKTLEHDEDEDNSSQTTELPHAEHQAVLDVLRMFDYYRDMNIKTKLTEHIPEEKLEQEGQLVLQKLLNRRVAVFIGLGALQYGNSEHCITEQVRFPVINTAGVLAQNGLKLQLDQTREEFQHWQQWPEFHLGTQLALQLSRKLQGLSHGALRTWIFYQKPSQPSNVYGGFMYGLGLLGYLDALNQIDIYHLLTMNLSHSSTNECTQVGVLLGIGASRKGKCDESTQKSLSVHIPSLIPSVLDLELPQNVPTSALCGLGLLFMGSGNRNFSEVALGLIGRKPTSDKVVDREGYSLAAGVTLGLINLGRGSVWKRELQVEERLVRFVQGGAVLPPPQSTLSTTFTQNEGSISSVKEGNMVNTHVTCPGALMALSLMYLQTGKQSIVESLSVPENFSELEQCNPNHTLLKVLCRNVIMWDQMPTTREGIYSQIPELIQFLFEQPLKKINQKYYLVYNPQVIDFMTVSQVYSSTIAGCLLALGIKFAGTHDKPIKVLLLQELDDLSRVKITLNELANDPESKNCVDQYTYFTNLLNGLIAVSLVMAGSFDHDCIVVCKKIRKKLEMMQVWHFGFHQALSIALGFLHLGSGAYSFKKDQQSIAMILVSVYPYYPSQPTDNRQFLQALRWTYVMAVKAKIFKTLDVKTNEMVQVKHEIQMKCFENHNPQQQIYAVKVIDEKYFPVDLNFLSQKKSIQLVYVQERKIAKINQQYLMQTSITKNLTTLSKSLRGDSATLAKIDQGLRGLREWSMVDINHQQFLQWFIELLQSDQLEMIPALSTMLFSDEGLGSVQCFYNNTQLPTVINKYQISQIMDKRVLDPSFLVKFRDYMGEKDMRDDEQFYLQLSKFGFPSLGELMTIKRFCNQIPRDNQNYKKIIYFYILKSYQNARLSEIIMNFLND